MKNTLKDSRNGSVKDIVVWFGILALVIGSVGAMVGFSGGGGGGQTASLLDAVSATDWTKGSPGAKVVLVEYGDYQCPACSAYFPLVEQLTQEMGDRFVLAYRHFPLRNSHVHAEIAARSAEAAGLQGKFWEMHQMIYENQRTWAESPDAKGIFVDYAKSLGLDIAKFEKDRDSAYVGDEVEKDFQSGLKSQVGGTPTFYLNGKKIENPLSYNDFKGLIVAALNEAGS